MWSGSDTREVSEGSGFKNVRGDWNWSVQHNAMYLKYGVTVSATSSILLSLHEHRIKSCRCNTFCLYILQPEKAWWIILWCNMNIKQKDIKTVCNYRKSHIQYIPYLQLCCHKVNIQKHYTHLSLLSGPTGSSEHFLLCFPVCEFKSDITPTTIYYVYRGAASCVFSLILKKHYGKKTKGQLLVRMTEIVCWQLMTLMFMVDNEKMQHRHEHSGAQAAEQCTLQMTWLSACRRNFSSYSDPQFRRILLSTLKYMMQPGIQM